MLPIQTNFTPLEYDQKHMTFTLQRAIEGGQFAVVGIPCECAWGGADSAEDLLVYQEAGATATSE